MHSMRFLNDGTYIGVTVENQAWWPEPVPAKGAQGFWEWPFEIEIDESEE